jgi:hypothetical protein
MYHAPSFLSFSFRAPLLHTPSRFETTVDGLVCAVAPALAMETRSASAPRLHHGLLTPRQSSRANTPRSSRDSWSPPTSARGTASTQAGSKPAVSVPPFSKPSPLPRAEALREMPASDAPLDSARKCWCCQRDDMLARLEANMEVNGGLSSREHQSPVPTRSEVLLQAEAQKLLKAPATLQRGKAMERLATSKLRSELNWGAPPLAQLRPSTKHLTSPSAQLTHRLEGIVWALEQQVTRQHYEMGAMRASAKAQDVALQSARAEAARCAAETGSLRVALAEAECWVEQLVSKAAEAETHASESAATIAALQEKLASFKKNKGKDKSNREQLEEVAKAKKAEPEKKVASPKEAAADFEVRWNEHVKKGGLKGAGAAAGVAGSPRSFRSSSSSR